MKTVRLVAVAVALITISTSSFAATEISSSESSGLKSMGRINIVQDMGNVFNNEASRKADAKGADFYVITSSGPLGNGSNNEIIAETYAKN